MLNLPRRRNRPIASPYERLGLTDLPFPNTPVLDPYSADPRVNGGIYAQSSVSEAIDKFERLLICPSDFPNRSKVATLWSPGDTEGSRGMGKTALLRYFRQRINSDWGLTEFDGQFYAAVIYVSLPEQVDRRWMEQLAWAALVDVCRNGVLDVAQAALRRDMLTDEQVEEVVQDNGTMDWRRLLDNSLLSACRINVADLDSKVEAQLLAYRVDHGPAQAFARGTFETYLRSLRRDGNLTPYYVPRDTNGLTRARTLLFNDIVRYLHSAGFAGGYLFIDDIENVTDLMPPRHCAEFAKNFGLCTVRPGYANTELGFFSCVLTTHQQSARKVAQAWGDAGLSAIARLDPDAPTAVGLPLPDEGQARGIIIAHLDHYRTDSAEQGSIRPFTEAGLQALIGKDRHPRRMLSNAANVLRYAMQSEAVAIDADLVAAAFSDAAPAPVADYTEGLGGAV